MAKNNIDTIRHSLSHILAMSVLDMFPEAKLGIGPSIDDGFYYDFDLPRTLIPEDLPILEEKMRKIMGSELGFEKQEMTAKKAYDLEEKAGNTYKAELVGDLIKDGEKKVSYYKSGGFSDLCSGPHVASTKELRSTGFKLTKIAGAYWKGSEKNKMLQRIYAVAFESPKELRVHLKKLEEAEKRDHRKLGQELDLFSFHNEGAGFPFWHPKGMVLKNQLLDYWREEHKKAGYSEIETPIILKEDLWHKSGHWDNYKDNMYFTDIDGQNFAIKPMNCPGGLLVYKSKLYSYRDLPLRIAELGLVHRHELSGVLHGLLRVRSFVQDDAHIYCTEDQVEAELKKVVKLIKSMYKKLGFTKYRVELSTRPEKSIGTDAQWKLSESILKKVDKDLKLNAETNAGDGAFYGPKFDFHIEDAIGRTWQCGTIQLDFSMPEKFDLEYVAPDGSKKRPVMIHRTVLGSLERFIGILIEHNAGALPLWLAPVQVNVISVGPSAKKYAKEVASNLESEGVRVQLRDDNETVGRKIREYELSKVPYALVIGDKEVKSKSVAVRKLHDRNIKTIKLSSFVKNIKAELGE